jgi:hypothetical protein
MSRSYLLACIGLVCAVVAPALTACGATGQGFSSSDCPGCGGSPSQGSSGGGNAGGSGAGGGGVGGSTVPPPPTCQGDATPCELRPAEGSLCDPTLSGSLGCSLGCSGVATDCFELFDVLSCERQEGCFWDDSEATCYGVASDCGSLVAASCETQQGCQAACAGIPLSCDAVGADQCSAQPGCTLM